MDDKLVPAASIEGDDDDARFVLGKVVPAYHVDSPKDHNIIEDSKAHTITASERGKMDAMREELGEGADGGGKRFNKGKTLLELTPPEWEWALADVTTQGSKKYAPRNWEQGMKWSTMVGCMKRHINKFLAGERYDGSEFDLEKGTTGCHHLAMVAWNALALMSYDLREIGENDLPPLQLELFERVNAKTSNLGETIHDDV